MNSSRLFTPCARFAAPRPFAAAFLASLLAAASVHAQTLDNWNGASNGNWNTPTNWDGDVVPNTGDASGGFVTINGTTTNQPAISTGSTTVGTMYIGVDTGSGPNTSLTVQGGSSLTDNETDLGFGAGSTGALTITGAGTTWTNLQSLFVGQSGNGTLVLTSNASATVGSTYATYVANTAGSIGNVSVSGGAVWNSSQLNVGYNGNGTMTISAAGNVTSLGSGIGFNPGAHGVVTVTGANSTWTTGTLLVNHGHLTVSSAGSVLSSATSLASAVLVTGANSTWSVNGAIDISNTTGVGILTVANGGSVTDAGGLIGDLTGNGAANITGAGSKWTDSSILTAAGNITVSAGGSLSSAGLLVYPILAAAPTVSVTDSGSILTTTGVLTLGAGNTGVVTLTVGNGGEVLCQGGSASYLGHDAGTQGVVLVTGANSTWTTSGEIDVGYSGSGNLAVTNGGNVTADGGVYLGQYDVSSGVATVDGAGSVLTSQSGIEVASFGGSGAFTVSNGGAVISNSDCYVADSSDTDSPGSVTITGANSTWTINHGTMYLEAYGASNLTISNGGTLNDNQGILGDSGSSANATANATVTGANSTWTTNTTLTIGHMASGNLTIANGGQVSCGNGYLGDSTGVNGTVSIGGADPVTGAGASWAASTVYIGDGGSGNLSVSSNGTLTTSGNLAVSLSSASKGVLNLSGNAQVTVGGSALVGGNGTATVNFQGGGTLAAAGLKIAGGNSTTLNMLLTGTTPGTDYTSVSVNNGNCTLGGALVVTLGGNYTPAVGDSFQLFQVTNGTMSGAFSKLTLPTLGAGMSWDSSHLTTNGTLAVTVFTPPTKPSISVQPVAQAVKAGSSVTFKVTASSTGALTYQWYFNNKSISKATSSSLTLTKVTSANNGTYDVVVTSGGGSVTSSKVALQVATIAPKIKTQPKAVSAKAGMTVSFKVVVTGDAPLSYQWQANKKTLKNGGNVSGATTATLKLTKITKSNGTTYDVVVTNPAGKVTSAVVKLTVK